MRLAPGNDVVFGVELTIWSNAVNSDPGAKLWRRALRDGLILALDIGIGDFVVVVAVHHHIVRIAPLIDERDLGPSTVNDTATVVLGRVRVQEHDTARIHAVLAGRLSHQDTNQLRTTIRWSGCLCIALLREAVVFREVIVDGNLQIFDHRLSFELVGSVQNGLCHREGEGSENGDDSDHDQQFNEGKAGAPSAIGGTEGRGFHSIQLEGY